MDAIKIISGLLCTAMVSGCASTGGANGPRGPKIVGSGQATEYGQYAEIGVEFSSLGDFVALVSPSRWKSPIATGGSLSWINPMAWSDDAGRTGRILLGEAVVVGGVVAAAAGGGGGGGGGDSGTTTGGGTTGGGTGPTTPPPTIPPTPPS
jgi:hypothetical protein